MSIERMKNPGDEATDCFLFDTSQEVKAFISGINFVNDSEIVILDSGREPGTDKWFVSILDKDKQ